MTLLLMALSMFGIIIISFARLFVRFVVLTSRSLARRKHRKQQISSVMSTNVSYLFQNTKKMSGYQEEVGS